MLQLKAKLIKIVSLLYNYIIILPLSLYFKLDIPFKIIQCPYFKKDVVVGH